MEQDVSRKVPKNHAEDFMVKMESAGNGTFQGRIENIYTGQVQYFLSFLEMITLMPKKLDSNDFTPNSTAMRSWK
jgi:hypothetical protein